MYIVEQLTRPEAKFFCKNCNSVQTGEIVGGIVPRYLNVSCDKCEKTIRIELQGSFHSTYNTK